MNLIFDRGQLLIVTEMYQCALKKEAEEFERLHRKWEATYGSLKRTQEALQESRLQIDQLRKEFNVPHPLYFMENDHVHMVCDTLNMMEEHQVEDKHDEVVDLKVLVKSHDEEYFG